MGARTRGLANNVLSSGKLDATDAVSGVISASNIANASLTSATSFGSVTGGVPAVASDPPSPAEGDIWYNTTSGQIKFRATVQAWSTGGNLPGTLAVMGNAGTQTTGLVFGGYTGTANTGATQTYDGSSWSTAPASMSTARRNLASCGIQTSALGFGGFTTTRVVATEEYDGSTWTGGGNLSSAKSGHGGAGLQTAGLAFGGTTIPGAATNATEEYDGSAWTAGNNMVTTRTNISNGAGVQTAALTFGGYQPSPGIYSSATEEYDGTSWTSGGNLNTARQEIADAGIQTAALGFGGGPGSGTSAETESYDGSTWTTLSATLATPRGTAGGCGTATEALTFGGENPVSGYLSATEEFTAAPATTIVG